MLKKIVTNQTPLVQIVMKVIKRRVTKMSLKVMITLIQMVCFIVIWRIGLLLMVFLLFICCYYCCCDNANQLAIGPQIKRPEKEPGNNPFWARIRDHNGMWE